MANLKDTTVHGEIRVTRGAKLLGPLLRFFKSPSYGSGEPIEYVVVVDTDVNIGANTNIQYNLTDYVPDVSKFDIRGNFLNFFKLGSNFDIFNPIELCAHKYLIFTYGCFTSSFITSKPMYPVAPATTILIFFIKRILNNYK